MCIMNDYAWTIIFWPIWRFCTRIHVSGVICLCSEINDLSQLDTHTTCVFNVNSKSQENVQPLYSIVKLLKDVWNMKLNQKNLPQLWPRSCGNLIYITNPAHAEMYSVQINVINSFTDFGQVGVFFQGLWFPYYMYNILSIAFNKHQWLFLLLQNNYKMNIEKLNKLFNNDFKQTLISQFLHRLWRLERWQTISYLSALLM